MAEQPKDMLQPFDDASWAKLGELVARHRQAVLATLDGGAPYTAMVAYAPEPGFGAFLVHLSDLSAHKQHLRADPRVSLIVCEPDNGRTEILQHARVALACRAVIVAKGTDAHAAAKACYLARFPAHQMMFGLGDFDLVRLAPREGLMNAGFGRAFRVTPADLAAAAARAGQ